jgi:hypothetical protein
VKARNGKQNENRASVEPNRLAYPVQSIRVPLGEFYRSACGFPVVILTIHPSYLGTEVSRRNEAAISDSA